MATITKKELELKVMSIMNEPGVVDAQGNSFMGADATGIDRLIDVSYPDAWTRIAKVAPRIWLGNKSFKTKVGIIKTFVLTGNNQGETGFKVNDILTLPGTVTAIFRVTTIGVGGTISTIELVSGGEGFHMGNYVLEYNLTTSGDIPGDLVINVQSTETALNDPIPNFADGTGYIKIPDDFYLLTKLKMVGWNVPAMEASVNNQRVANMQSNENTRGSRLRPSVVIDIKDIDGVIKPVLVYYSLQKGLTKHEVEEALYVPIVQELKDKADDYDLGVSDQVIVPLAYLCAATVFTILEKPQVASALEQRAEAMLPGLVSVKGTNATVKQ